MLRCTTGVLVIPDPPYPPRSVQAARSHQRVGSKKCLLSRGLRVRATLAALQRSVPGGQGQPVRAERSEPRSGALDGRAKRSYLRLDRVHVIEGPGRGADPVATRDVAAGGRLRHPRKQHKRRFLRVDVVVFNRESASTS